MFRFSRLTIVLLTTVVSAVLFGAAGHVTALWLTELQRDRQLNELAELALRRSEAAVDFAVAALQEITERTELSCGSESVLQDLRFQVYELGPIKDIRITNHDGTVRCAAFSETLEFDRAWPRRTDMTSFEDGALFRVETFSGNALGVLRDAGPGQSLVAILANGAELLDVMPRSLRAYSQVSIELARGEPVYRLNPGGRSLGPDDAIGEFIARSERYPLRSFIRVDAGQLSNWDRELVAPMTLVATLLGLAFGLLLARTFTRPESPVEALDRAIARSEFVPHLQPVYDLGTGTIVGCEILARWQQPDGSLLPPASFVPLAEASGRIEAITWLLLSRTLERLQPLLRSHKTLTVSVNVVPSHFMSDDFAEDLRALVGKYKVARRQVVVEITEREPFADLAAAAATAARLRNDGFRIAIDDVGVGHSGLSHLKSLGANILKIDKFFIDTIDLDPTARSIVEMLVRLARMLDMSVVAEGIEDRSQVAGLRACGVTLGQGFHLSRPVSTASFVELFNRNQERAADPTTTASSAA